MQERIRQAKLAFNVLLGATVVSGAIAFTGVYFLICGQVSEGTMTSTGGLISNIAFAKLGKDANDLLDKAMQDAEAEEKEKAYGRSLTSCTKEVEGLVGFSPTYEIITHTRIQQRQ